MDEAIDEPGEGERETTMTLDPEDARDAAPDDEIDDVAEGAEGAEPESASEADAEAQPDGAEAEPEEDAAPKRLGRGAKLDDEELERNAVALLFASPEPLSLGRLVGLLENPQLERVEAILERLDERFAAAGLPLQVLPLRGGFTLSSTEEMSDVVARLAKGNAVERVSPAALETLAVIAYRQPVTKAEIEAIRGVQAGPILRALVDRGLARVVGRADQPGHPLQYGTTKEFLDRFGLMNLKELPRDTELARD